MADQGAPRRVHPSLIGRKSYKSIFSLPVIFGAIGLLNTDAEWSKPVNLPVLGITTDLRMLAIAGLVMLILVRIGLSVLFAYADWRKLTYSIDPDVLTIRRGRVFKKERTIQLAQIQNIEIERGIFDRIFGTALVKVEVASGIADEGTLEALPLAEVARLHAAAGHPLPETLRIRTEDVAEPPLLELGPARLLFAGLFGWWVAGAALLLPLGERVFDQFRGKDDPGQLLDRAKAILAGFSWGETIALFAVGAVLMFLVAAVASVVVNFGFRVTRQGEALRVTRGLLQTKERLIPLDRICGIGVIRVSLPVAGTWYKLNIRLQDSSAGEGSVLLAPLARWPELDRLLDALAFAAPDEDKFAGSNRRFAVFHMLETARMLLGILFLPLATLFFFVRDWFAVGAGAAAALITIVVAAETMRVLTHHHQIGSGRLYLRHGRMFQRTLIVRLADVQGTILRQSLADRLLGLASVTFDIRGVSALNRPEVPGIAVTKAVALVSTGPDRRKRRGSVGSEADLALA